MAQGSTALRPHGRQIAFLPVKTIAFNTTGIASGVSMGKIPRGSKIAFATCSIDTGFSAAGTRVLTVGTNASSYNNIISTVTEETASTSHHVIGCSLSFTQDTEVFVKMTTTGTAAAAGAATLAVAFFPPLELS